MKWQAQYHTSLKSHSMRRTRLGAWHCVREGAVIMTGAAVTSYCVCMWQRAVNVEPFFFGDKKKVLHYYNNGTIYKTVT